MGSLFRQVAEHRLADSKRQLQERVQPEREISTETGVESHLPLSFQQKINDAIFSWIIDKKVYLWGS